MLRDYNDGDNDEGRAAGEAESVQSQTCVSVGGDPILADDSARRKPAEHKEGRTEDRPPKGHL